MDNGPAAPSVNLNPTAFAGVIGAFTQVSTTPGADNNNLLGITIG